jgi:hypothetical protein
MTKLLAALLVIGGVIGLFINDPLAIRLAVGALVLSGVLGIWQIADQVDDWLKKQP